MLSAVRSAASSERSRPDTLRRDDLGLDLLAVLPEELHLHLRIHVVEHAGEGVQPGEHQLLLGDQLAGAHRVGRNQRLGGHIARRPEILVEGEAR